MGLFISRTKYIAVFALILCAAIGKAQDGAVVSDDQANKGTPNVIQNTDSNNSGDFSSGSRTSLRLPPRKP